MDPVTGLSVAKAAAELAKTLYAAAKKVKDHETKQMLDQAADKLIDMKQQALALDDTNRELQDANRALQEKLRFKSGEFEFKNPFWYEKTNASQPLCPKCFANEKVGPMSPVKTTEGGTYRQCLVCDKTVVLTEERTGGFYGGTGQSWMDY